MSNTAELYTADARPLKRSRKSSPSRSHFVAAASYHLPVAWLAMYREEDLQMVAEDCGAVDYRHPMMSCRTERAIDQLYSRKAAIMEMLPQTPWASIEELIEAIAEANQPYIVLDATDVGTDSDPEAWAEKLKIMTSAFRTRATPSSINDGWKCYVQYFPLPDDRNPSVSYFVGEGF